MVSLPLSEEHCRKLERMYLGCPINRAKYPSTRAEFTDKAASISLEVEANQFHAMGAAHGSVYFKLIDDAAYFAAQAHVEDSYLLTVSMNLNFTRPVTGGAHRVPRSGPSPRSTDAGLRGGTAGCRWPPVGHRTGHLHAQWQAA